MTVKKQTSVFQEKYRLNYSETEIVNDLEDIKNSIIRECIRYLEIDDRLYISTIADAPASSGLGSSSTFCVGLLNALYKLKGEAISAGRLADEAAHIECDILKRPMGKQDHYAAAYGGINYIRFYDDESVTLSPVSMTSKNMKELSNSIAMFWTGLTRPSESVLTEQDEKNKDNENVLKKMKDQALELSNILTKTEISITNLGDLLHQGWEYKKTLASNISNQSIDNWYAKAIEYGAVGGKISGAGGGGFLTIIAKKENHKTISNILSQLRLRQYRFGLDSNGATITEIK